MRTLRARRRRRSEGGAGNTLVEVVIAVLIFAISALCLFPLLGSTRAGGIRGTLQIQALGLVEGRVNALLADLALGESQSPLFQATPMDFSKRYVTASGNAASPWILSATPVSETISLPSLAGYRMETSIQFFDDPSDGLGAADVNGDPHDALKVRARIVPAQSGGANAYPTVWLETFWYRNP